MTVMTAWDLFEDLRATQDAGAAGDQGARLASRPAVHQRRCRPRGLGAAIDISERKDAYLVAVELPGVKADDLEITFEDGLLTIQGSGASGTTLPRRRCTGPSVLVAPSAARSPCRATSRRTRSRPPRRTACCRSWCPRHRTCRPSASGCAPAQGTQPSRQAQRPRTPADRKAAAAPAKDRHPGRRNLLPSPLRAAVTAGGTSGPLSARLTRRLTGQRVRIPGVGPDHAGAGNGRGSRLAGQSSGGPAALSLHRPSLDARYRRARWR